MLDDLAEAEKRLDKEEDAYSNEYITDVYKRQGLYCAINCYTLIISWFMAMGIIVERSFYYIEFIRCIVLRCQVTVV